MFGTRIANRTARGMAVGALILSISATTFGGSANAAPLADETQSCSDAAHARNEAVHVLHDAWKGFSSDLRDLAGDARKLQHESEKASAGVATDARSALASAKQDLNGIWSQAHEDLLGAADLGTACKEEAEDEDTTTTTTTTATAPTDSSGSAGTDTTGLETKYKDIVDLAIADMQKVVDDATKAVTDLTTAAESKDATEVTKVKKDLEKAKADRETA
jgi:hypothetical protein